MEVVMKRVNIKRNYCRTGITIVVLVALSHVNSFALTPPPLQNDTDIAFFAVQSNSVADGFASSHNMNPSENIENKEDVTNATHAQTRLEIRRNAKETSNELDDDSNITPAKLEEMPDWQLIHSAELPFGDYFIDTRIVGAVRYHADYSLEKEYVILRELSNIQKDLSQYLAIPHPKETIEVFFFQSQYSYKRFLAKELHEAPFDREALYFKQSAPGMVLIYQKPDMTEDLRHEMTHAFLHASLPYVPLWLDEGLAEYFEKPRETRARINPYFSSISRKIMFGQVPSLTRLEKMRYFDQMGVNEYCEAWSWVHFLIHHSRETHQLLASYMRLLAEQGERTPPLDLYLGKTIPETKKSYLDHFRNWKNRQESSIGTNNPTWQSPSGKQPSTSKFSLGWSDSVFR